MSPEIQLGGESPELPELVHGFAVEIFAGPYPLHAAGTHRRAVYARLTPTTDELRKKLRWRGDKAILGEAPVDQETAQAIFGKQLPENELEALSLAALRPAAALAKQVAEA
jgi:hypothetical protein